jgi:3-deoxy-D-manno-octulosonic acid kinase
LLGDGVLTLSEGIPDSENLQNRWLATEREDARRSWLLSAAEALAGLHGAGYSHGDCKWSNLLISGSQCYLVDLDAARRSARAGRYQARDLARFTLNAEEESLAQAEYDLFFETYCAGLGLSRDRIITPMLPQLRKLRGRHRSRYGKRGQPLW